MKINEKKFQIINVGINLMSNEYEKWLHQKGYELADTKMGADGKVESYTFKVKENEGNFE